MFEQLFEVAWLDRSARLGNTQSVVCPRSRAERGPSEDLVQAVAVLQERNAEVSWKVDKLVKEAAKLAELVEDTNRRLEISGVGCTLRRMDSLAQRTDKCELDQLLQQAEDASEAAVCSGAPERFLLELPSTSDVLPAATARAADAAAGPSGRPHRQLAAPRDVDFRRHQRRSVGHLAGLPSADDWGVDAGDADSDGSQREGHCQREAPEHDNLRATLQALREELRREAAAMWSALAELADIVGVDGARFIAALNRSGEDPGESLIKSNTPAALALVGLPQPSGQAADGLLQEGDLRRLREGAAVLCCTKKSQEAQADTPTTALGVAFQKLAEELSQDVSLGAGSAAIEPKQQDASKACGSSLPPEQRQAPPQAQQVPDAAEVEPQQHGRQRVCETGERELRAELQVPAAPEEHPKQKQVQHRWARAWEAREEPDPTPQAAAEGATAEHTVTVLSARSGSMEEEAGAGNKKYATSKAHSVCSETH